MAKQYIKFSFKVAGETQFSRAFETMGAEISDLRSAFQKIASRFYAHMQRVFQNEGAVDEKSRWVPLSRVYEGWKRAHFPGAKILHLTGRMERSLIGPNAPDSVRDIRRDSMLIGSSVSYAASHQRGRIIFNLPQRKIIDLTAAQRKDWTRIIHEHIYNKAVQSWGAIRPDFR